VSELRGRGIPVLASARRETSGLPPGIELVAGDLCETTTAPDLLARLGAIAPGRVVVHLAGDARAHDHDADRSAARNMEITGRVLDACRAQPVSCFMLASTALVYGGSVREPLSEASMPRPQGEYARSKLLAEAAVRQFATATGCRCEVLRLGNVHGPDSAPSTVVGHVVGRLCAGDRALQVRDRGPVRDFVYVDDVAEAFVRLMQADGSGFEITNIGTGVSRSVGDLVDTALRLRGLAVRESPPVASDDVIELVNERLRARTGWVPSTSLEDGLRRCLGELVA